MRKDLVEKFIKKKSEEGYCRAYKIQKKLKSET